MIQISGVPVPCRGGGGDYHFFEKKSVIILGSGKILSDNPEGPRQGVHVQTIIF